jgi:predicted peptidase
VRAISNSSGYDYLVSQPQDSTATPPTGWPLILSLHGAAQRGAEEEAVTRLGLPRLLSGAAELTAAEMVMSRDIAARFVVVAPQCPHYEVWNEVEVLSVLDEACGRFHLDLARVYLTGFSMGGFGAWLVGLRQPQRFAALVPICGGGRIADIAAAVANHPEALRRLGVWAFHGACDRVVPLEESQRMIDELRRRAVPDVHFTIYPEGGHDVWSATYANPELYAWLLRHAR